MSKKLPLLKNWTLPTAKCAKEGKGGKNSAADCECLEAKLFEDHIEDEDEDRPHASARSLQTKARFKEQINQFTKVE